MKTFQKIFLLLALALAFQLRAAAADATKISGTVVDAQGVPVAGATVDCYQYAVRIAVGSPDMEAKQHATTDAQGAFELLGFNGMGVVLVKKAGFPPAWRSWDAAPQDSTKIALAAASVLAGVVVDDAGRPVADAEVWVSAAMNTATTDIGQPNFLFGKVAQDLFSTRTSTDGKFRIENFPANAQASLVVKKAGKAMHPAAISLRYDALPINAGQEDITLVLDPAGSVAGKVVARETGQPLANAVINLQPTAMQTVFSGFDLKAIVSAADGSFLIPDVPAGAYQVMANFTNHPVADWVANPVSVTVATGATAAGVQIDAFKGGVLEVTVRGKNNHEPLADTSVGVNTENYNRGASTGTNGMAYFRLPPGPFSVYAIKPDLSQAQAQTTVTEGQTNRLTIELDAPLKVTGIVRDAAGVPVAGASVMVAPDYGNSRTIAKSDANGHYEATWQKPTWAGASSQKFYLIARHVERKLAAMQELDETTPSVDLTLKPAMRVSGRVQDTKGKAVTNVNAYVQVYLENMSFTISRQMIHPDEQGRLQADALPPGERYGWSVSGRGYGSAQQQMDVADAKADHYDFPPLIVKLADRKLAGRVLGTNDAPVAGVQIYMQGEGQPYGNAITDTDGRFVFDAVCEGGVSVTANFKGSYGQAQANGGDTNVVIRFDARNRVYSPTASAKTLTGTVYDPSGKPAVGIRVIVTPSFGPVQNARTDTNGEYSINWQSQPGLRDAKYFAIARDTARNLAAIEAVGTNQARAILRLAPALAISGTAQDAKGVPLPRANVSLNLLSGNMGGMVDYDPIKIDADGAFTVSALPMGQQYNLYVMAKDYGTVRKSVSKTQSQTNSVQLSPFKLKAADRLLAGQVLDADKKPLSGAQVSINGTGQPNGNVRTDATGHFKFKVCSGPISLYAYSLSSAGRNATGTAQAHGGDTNVVVTMGVQQTARPVIERETPLKPQPWTLAALANWPASHKTGVIVLAALQGAVLLVTAGAIFRFTRKRG
jgi:protocatechuate 3,4-dioxygenase beta subunit